MGIKIRSLRSLKNEMLAVSRGEHPAPEDANQPSFESIEAVARLLTSENRQLLAAIEEKHPVSVAELARLVGRQEPNVSRTLSKFESMGFVRLNAGQGRAKRPELLVRHLTVDIDLYAYEPFSVAAKLPPLQGEGWGGDGVGMPIKFFLMYPIPLPASPLKGEERPCHIA